MKPAALVLAFLLQLAAIAPALAQGCANPCPEGQTYSAEEGRCVAITTFI